MSQNGQSERNEFMLLGVITYKMLSQLTYEEMKLFSQSFDTVLIFTEAIERSSARSSVIDEIKKCGKRVLYFSEDCSMSRREICNNMRVANFEVEPDEIVCVTSLIAKYLKRLLNEKKVYVIGPSGMSEELDQVGLPNFGTGPDILKTDLPTFVHSYVEDPEIGAVVVNLDEYFSYPKMLRAASYLSIEHVAFVACTKRTSLTAAIVDCIETCADKKPLIFDTSYSTIIDTIVHSYRLIPEKTLIVLPTDDDHILSAHFQSLQYFLSSKKTNELIPHSLFRACDLLELATCLKLQEDDKKL